jgi:hypothetical protein
MYRLSLPLLLVTGAIAFAQTSGNPPVLKNSPILGKTADSVVLHTTPADNTGCPVGFYASRKATGQIMSAGDTRQAGPTAQGLHLMLDRLAEPGIESIEITVYGVSSKARVLPAGPAPTDISKTFDLTRQPGSNSLTEADVWMQNVGSLSHVDLISIHYADGTTWRTTQDLKCRAVPSNFLLVDKK